MSRLVEAIHLFGLLFPVVLRANPTYAVIVPMQSSFWLRDLVHFSPVPSYFDSSYVDQENKDAIIVKGVFARYDWRIRPKGLNTTIRKFGEGSDQELSYTRFGSGTGGPVVIMANLYLRTISKIDDVNMVSNHRASALYSELQ